MSELLDQVRSRIEASSESRYAIAKATGIDQAVLSRLMSGQAGLRFEALERLVDHLGYEIVLRPKRRQRKGR